MQKSAGYYIIYWTIRGPLYPERNHIPSIWTLGFYFMMLQCNWWLIISERTLRKNTNVRYVFLLFSNCKNSSILLYLANVKAFIYDAPAESVKYIAYLNLLLFRIQNYFWTSWSLTKQSSTTSWHPPTLLTLIF